MYDEFDDDLLILKKKQFNKKKYPDYLLELKLYLRNAEKIHICKYCKIEKIHNLYYFVLRSNTLDYLKINPKFINTTALKIAEFETNDSTYFLVKCMFSLLIECKELHIKYALLIASKLNLHSALIILSYLYIN